MIKNEERVITVINTWTYKRYCEVLGNGCTKELNPRESSRRYKQPFNQGGSRKMRGVMHLLFKNSDTI